jgi:hypothetical protein
MNGATKPVKAVLKAVLKAALKGLAMCKRYANKLLIN